MALQRSRIKRLTIVQISCPVLEVVPLNIVQVSRQTKRLKELLLITERAVGFMHYLRHKVDDLLSVCPDFDQVPTTADSWSDLDSAAIAAVVV